ncbi:MAG: cation-transporting P-type ATPase, partial [Micrococcales bacterium]|nr:cation-transporting P-type ATPase [Micrococcales bacterium]
MSDACGCSDEAEEREVEEAEESGSLWQVTEIRAAALAALVLAAAWLVSRADAPEWLVLASEGAALVIAAYTFVPGTIRRLRRGKIGVGTLMTIAAVGAVILGQVEEAAMLAILYSISEGLEEY